MFNILFLLKCIFVTETKWLIWILFKENYSCAFWASDFTVHLSALSQYEPLERWKISKINFIARLLQAETLQKLNTVRYRFKNVHLIVYYATPEWENEGYG